MIAKVLKDNNKEYYSYVFATFNEGWFKEVLVFNNEDNVFEFISVYNTIPSIKRKVFIIDTDISNFIYQKEIKLNKKKKFENSKGYDWVLNDIDFLNKIINKEEIDEKYINKAKQLNDNYNIDEWHYIMNEKDILDLNAASWGFHDSHLEDIKYIKKESYSDPTIVQVLFTGCWECDILLEFKRDVFIHFYSDDSYTDEITISSILIKEGFIYWVNDKIEDVSELQEYHTYFKARSLKWKMIVNK